jgi:hypothetical protein
MAVTLINGNQISSLTNATINQLQFTNTTSILQLPTGTTVQRPSTAAYGTMRFNTTEDKVEVYVTNSNGQGADGWSFVGAGGPHVGNTATSYVRTNSSLIDANIVIGAVANGGQEYSNGYSAGPVEIGSGFTFTIESGASYYVLGESSDAAYFENLAIYGTLDTKGGMIDSGASRENLVSMRLSTLDTIVNMDFVASNILYVTGINQNFNINLLNFPTDNIGIGQANVNKTYGVVIKYFNGDPRFRPTGTILLNGSSIGNARWTGGGAPATLTANREVVVGLTVTRVVEMTNLVGGTNVVWKAYLTFTEFG